MDSPEDIAAVQAARIELANKIRLAAVRLISLNTDIQLKGGTIPTRAQIVTEVSTAVSTDRHHIQVNANVRVVGRPTLESFEDPNPEESVLNLSLHYQAVYGLKDDSDPIKLVEDNGQDIAAMGIHMLWPYVRSIVQSTTLAMGLPPIMVPIYIAALQQLQQED
jgi:preprotein translocase subunit SecB